MRARRKRLISSIKAARKAYGDFPADARIACLRAQTIVAEGEKPDVAKPLHGLGAGIWEVALRHRSDAYSVVYSPDRCRYLDRSCLSEEIDERHQDIAE